MYGVCMYDNGERKCRREKGESEEREESKGERERR